MHDALRVRESPPLHQPASRESQKFGQAIVKKLLMDFAVQLQQVPETVGDTELVDVSAPLIFVPIWDELCWQPVPEVINALNIKEV